MTHWQKFAGTLASLMLASGIVLSATTPSLADMTTAKRPVAVVEEVKGKVIGVEFMDYVTPGTVIKLGPSSLSDLNANPLISLKLRILALTKILSNINHLLI